MSPLPDRDSAGQGRSSGSVVVGHRRVGVPDPDPDPLVDVVDLLDLDKTHYACVEDGRQLR